MTKAAELAQLPNIPFVGRNRLINGGFDVWQRGTIFTSAGSFGCTADRWAFYRNSLVAGGTVRRNNTGVNSRYRVRVQRDVGNTATDGSVFGQIIEAANCVDLGGKTVTLSATIKAGPDFSSASSLINVAVTTGTVEDEGNITNPAGWTGSATQSYNTPITTSDQRLEFNFDIPAGTKEIRVTFSYVPTGTAGVEDWFELEQVQLEVGEKATEFEALPVGQVLALCQRYFWRCVDGSRNSTELAGVGFNNATTNAEIFITAPTSMRTVPSMAFSDPSHFTALAGGVAASLSLISQSSPRLFRVDVGLTGLTIGDGNFLRANTSASATLDFSAEL